MDEQLGRPNTKVEPDTNLPASQTFPSFTDEYELKEHNSERSTIDTITSNDVGQDPNAVGFAATADKTLTLSVEAKVSNTSNSPASSPTSTASIWDSKVLRSTPFGRYMLTKDDLQPHPHIPDNQKFKETPPWKTTIIRYGPLSGIFAMLLAAGCIVSCLSVLAKSNRRAESWSVPPSTWIAIFTAIANLSVRYAAIQGVVIAWWARATRGSTLSSLHYDWRAGTTFRGAILSGRRMGLLGLACICSTLVVVDGPLLQRSTTVVSAPLENTVPLNVTMAEEIPHGLTGVWGHSSDYYKLWSGNIQQFNHTIPTSNPDKTVPNGPITTNSVWMGLTVSDPWYNSKPLRGVVRGCQGKCTAKVRAPALAVTSCHSYLLPVDYHAQDKFTVQYGKTWSAPPMGSYAYLTAPSMVIENDEEWLNLVTGYATTKDCKGVLNYTACTLKSAIGEYDIHLDGDSLTVTNQESPTIIALANNTAPNNTWVEALDGHPSTLSGIASFAINTWNSGVWIQKEPNGNIVPELFGGLSVMTLQVTDDPFCPSFRDPRPKVIAGLNRLMFYTGGLAALQYSQADLTARMDDGLSINKTVIGQLEGVHNVYHTDYFFWMAAAIIEVVCIALIAPTYWGWWKLGRHFSLSPLEMANAFEAPLLQDCNSNLSGREIAKYVGDRRIQYGVRTDQNYAVESTKLAFADPAEIGQLQNGAQFDV